MRRTLISAAMLATAVLTPQVFVTGAQAAPKPSAINPEKVVKPPVVAPSVKPTPVPMPAPLTGNGTGAGWAPGATYVPTTAQQTLVDEKLKMWAAYEGALQGTTPVSELRGLEKTVCALAGEEVRVDEVPVVTGTP